MHENHNGSIAYIEEPAYKATPGSQAIDPRELGAACGARGAARQGRPIENAYVESFNGKFRDEYLNEHWFASLVETHAIIEAWRVGLQSAPATQLARAPDTE